MSWENEVPFASHDNDKMNLGQFVVWSISLEPVVSCKPGVPCASLGCRMKGKCAMRKALRLTVQRNYRLYKEDRVKYFDYWKSWFTWNRPRFARWNVLGDIPDEAYYLGIIAVAEHCPETRFLVFTKRDDIVPGYITPPNLTVVLSAWPGYEHRNPDGLPVAWCHSSAIPRMFESRVPSDAKPCSGHCWDCRSEHGEMPLCWGLQRGESVVFEYFYGSMNRKSKGESK